MGLQATWLDKILGTFAAAEGLSPECTLEWKSKLPDNEKMTWRIGSISHVVSHMFLYIA
jgi:hypothetical protein